MMLIIIKFRNQRERGCSSNGRALALHARGTGFDPPHLQFVFGRFLFPFLFSGVPFVAHMDFLFLFAISFCVPLAHMDILFCFCLPPFFSTLVKTVAIAIE